jgi:CHAT domain-containing protein
MNEGNLGLSRVFFFAGARSIISTLWPVNDKSSSTFMKHFYDAYFSGRGKGESLRLAKKAMRDSGFSHPFYWAGYVLTGEF